MRSVREILIAIEECRPSAAAGDPYAQGVVDMLEWCLGSMEAGDRSALLKPTRSPGEERALRELQASIERGRRADGR